VGEGDAFYAIMKNEALAPIVFSASRTGGSALEPDERRQLGWTAALEAVSSYDTSKGCTLSTWVWRRVRWAILDELRRARRTREHFPHGLEGQRQGHDSNASARCCEARAELALVRKRPEHALRLRVAALRASGHTWAQVERAEGVTRFSVRLTVLPR
jgi:DNA-directed RNA polymerase specialized sigma24 family protein